MGSALGPNHAAVLVLLSINLCGSGSGNGSNTVGGIVVAPSSTLCEFAFGGSAVMHSCSSFERC